MQRINNKGVKIHTRTHRQAKTGGTAINWPYPSVK